MARVGGRAPGADPQPGGGAQRRPGRPGIRWSKVLAAALAGIVMLGVLGGSFVALVSDDTTTTTSTTLPPP